MVANAHLENYAMKLFLWADKEDRAANFNKNVVKAFYTSGILFEVGVHKVPYLPSPGPRGGELKSVTGADTGGGGREPVPPLEL